MPEDAPAVKARLSRGAYFTVATNARHALAGTLSVPPLRFLVSRTITAPARAGDLYALAAVRA